MSPSFDALGVSADVVRALSARGITSPFDVQNLVLPDGLAGLDVLVASPTGSGKTLAFGIPMIERTARGGGQPSALVLVPTRELASQVVDELRPLAKTRGLRIEAVYGGTSVMGQAKKARGAEILVATPGRLADLIDRRLISLGAVKVLVLDEADRMLDMGFRPQVDRLLSERPGQPADDALLGHARGARSPSSPAATPSNAVQHPRRRRPRRRRPERSSTSSTPSRPTASSRASPSSSDASAASRSSSSAPSTAPTSSPASSHRDHGVPSVVMHGNMSQNARERSLSRFESGHVTTLIATDVAARGLDIDDITHVINFDPPRTGDDYVHRVGRTGRAGRSGTGLTLVLPEQRNDVAQLADRLGHGAAFAASGLPTGGTAPVRSSRRPRTRTRRRA